MKRVLVPAIAHSLRLKGVLPSRGHGSSYYTDSSSYYTDAEPHAARGEKEKSFEALKSMLTLPDDGLIPIGSLPVAIEDSPILESLRDTAGFAEFRQGSHTAVPSGSDA